MSNLSILLIVIQIVVALGLLNVWLLRFRKSTSFRGKDADSMPEEFEAYGLPKWFMGLVGALKVICALMLLAGIFWPGLVFPAAACLVVLMLGALAMHIKVGDPLKRSLPALAMLVLNGILVVGSL